VVVLVSITAGAASAQTPIGAAQARSDYCGVWVVSWFLQCNGVQQGASLGQGVTNVVSSAGSAVANVTISLSDSAKQLLMDPVGWVGHQIANAFSLFFRILGDGVVGGFNAVGGFIEGGWAQIGLAFVAFGNALTSGVAFLFFQLQVGAHALTGAIISAVPFLGPLAPIIFTGLMLATSGAAIWLTITIVRGAVRGFIGLFHLGVELL
jgi:hypothetical protein